MNDPNEEDGGDCSRGSEPVGLIPSRRDGEGEGSAGCVPYAVVITSNHMKRVLSWGQVSEERLSTASDFTPLVIPAVEFVLKAHALGNRQTQPVITNHNGLRQRWENGIGMD